MYLCINGITHCSFLFRASWIIDVWTYEIGLCRSFLCATNRDFCKWVSCCDYDFFFFIMSKFNGSQWWTRLQFFTTPDSIVLIGQIDANLCPTIPHDEPYSTTIPQKSTIHLFNVGDKRLVCGFPVNHTLCCPCPLALHSNKQWEREI